MKEVLTDVLNNLGMACWVEVTTKQPECIYYFGPFLTRKEAERAQSGYLEDLENEGAQGISAVVKRCKPEKLTIFEEVEEVAKLEGVPSLSGQPS